MQEWSCFYTREITDEQSSEPEDHMTQGQVNGDGQGQGC